jgi:hypothetical protein
LFKGGNTDAIESSIGSNSELDQDNPSVKNYENGITAYKVAFSKDDIITISRSGLAGNSIAYKSRSDEVKVLNDISTFVRKDQILEPSADYDANEWIEFKDKSLSITFNDFKRHPHDPLLSDITADSDSNAKEGVHHFGPVTITGNNWENGTPDRSRTVIINNKYIHSSGTLGVDKLIVKEGKRLSVDNQLLLVTNDINIETDAEIRLIGTSQLIQTHKEESKVTGDGKIYIDRESDLESVFRYNFMSSPVTTNSDKDKYTVFSAFKDGTNALDDNSLAGVKIARDIEFIGNWNGSPYNAEHDYPSLKISNRWIHTFAPNEGKKSNWLRTGAWGAIKATDGFIFKGPGIKQNYTFAGSPNDGELKTNVGAGQTYLIGNPFSSAMNALKFIKDNLSTIEGTLHLWDHVGSDNSSEFSGHYAGGYMGGYATVNLTMGTTPLEYSFDPIDNPLGDPDSTDQDENPEIPDGFNDISASKTPGTYIPVGQGFYVVGDSDGGDIIFNNDQREFITEDNTNSIFFKSGTKKRKNKTANEQYLNSLSIIKLGMDFLNNNDGISYHRQIGVSFLENNSFAFDKGYDSEMFDIGNTDFYWKFPNDDNNYVISGVQAFDEDLEVPLEVVVENTAELSIMVDEVKNISSNIYIIDKVTGISYDISEEKTSINLEPGTYTDRFALAFKPYAVLSADNEIIDLSTHIYVDHKSHDLIVTKDYDVNIKKVVLYNVIGETISTWKINEHADAYRLALKPGLPAGVYLSKTTTNNGINNKKIIIE